MSRIHFIQHYGSYNGLWQSLRRPFNASIRTRLTAYVKYTYLLYSVVLIKERDDPMSNVAAIFYRICKYIVNFTG